MDAIQPAPFGRCSIESMMYSRPEFVQDATVTGGCLAKYIDGSICGKPLSWTSPYHQFCITHASHNTPCYFLTLPTELRQEIFRYLMPTSAIDSLLVFQYNKSNIRPSLRTVFPTPLLCLYLGFNREIYEEIKDVFYKMATFTIDVSREGISLCGRRILEPIETDGFGSRYEKQAADARFIQNFAWSSVRNYDVSIAVERQMDSRGRRISDWDEEVELYDIRDFVAVLVSGVLAKARQLNNLQTRIYLRKFDWSHERGIYNTKLLIGPLERLRCVRNPRLIGVFRGEGPSEVYAHRHRALNDINNRCITPPTLDPMPVLGPGMPTFDSLASEWERCLALEAPSNILPKTPMTKLFVEFKALHNKLSTLIPLAVRHRRYCYLHRARVAREHEDVVSFRAVAAQLLQQWHHRLWQLEQEKLEVNAALQRVVDADTFSREDIDAPATEPPQRRTEYVNLT